LLEKCDMMLGGGNASMGTWFVLQSNPRKEFFLLEQLKLREIRTYFPFLHVKRVNPRARKVEPYFPGYLFIQADLNLLGMMAFQRLPGAAGLVRFGDDIATIDDLWLQDMQKKIELLEEERGIKHPTFTRGDKVFVHSGVFAGYEAIFDTQLPGSERVRLLLKWLENRFVQVEIPVEQVVFQR
jgi:transcription antitermination factor NusG